MWGISILTTQLLINQSFSIAPTLNAKEQSDYFLNSLIGITDGCAIQSSFLLLKEHNVPLEYCELPPSNLGLYQTMRRFNPTTLVNDIVERKICLKNTSKNIQSDENLMWVLIHEARHAQQEILYGQENLEARLEKILRKEFFCPIFIEKHPLPLHLNQEPYASLLAQMQEQYVNEHIFYELDADYIAAEGMFCLQNQISRKNLTYGFKEFFKIYQQTAGNQQDFYDFFVKDQERLSRWKQSYRQEFQESVTSWHDYFMKYYKQSGFLQQICQ